eukprot:4007828-Pleurochrysis_carterae.AAC.4
MACGRVERDIACCERSSQKLRAPPSKPATTFNAALLKLQRAQKSYLPFFAIVRHRLEETSREEAHLIGFEHLRGADHIGGPVVTKLRDRCGPAAEREQAAGLHTTSNARCVGSDA